MTDDNTKDTGNQPFKTNVNLPEHPNTKFDDNKFLELLAGSVSLSIEEKKKIITMVPTLSQFQIDELMKIFVEEIEKFDELAKKHPDQVKSLREKHKNQWVLYETSLVQEAKQAEDQQKADEIKKQLGLM